MTKTVLFVILDQYADWEAAYLSSMIVQLGQNQYSVKTVSLTADPVRSIGGFTVLPDYGIDSAPADFEGLILIGGMSWRHESARKVEPLVKKALEKQKVVAGICDASGFLGTIGILNNVRHTSNDLNDLKQWAGEAYTGEKNYAARPAVRDKNIVTANGTASLEFAKEALLALNVAPENKILEWYNFYKSGCYEAPMPTV